MDKHDTSREQQHYLQINCNELSSQENLKCMLLCEISQDEKATYCMSPRI